MNLFKRLNYFIHNTWIQISVAVKRPKYPYRPINCHLSMCLSDPHQPQTCRGSSPIPFQKPYPSIIHHASRDDHILTILHVSSTPSGFYIYSFKCITPHSLHCSKFPFHLFDPTLTNFESQPSIMSDQSRPMTQKPHYDSSAPNVRQAIGFLIALAAGAVLLGLSGLTLTGTVISLIISTPVLILFSPILVPAGIVMFLTTTGLLFSAACGVAAVTALSWIYNYVAGKHPPGSDQVDYARARIASKARDMKERVQEYGHQHVQQHSTAAHHHHHDNHKHNHNNHHHAANQQQAS